jgi:hypothetical protein
MIYMRFFLNTLYFQLLCIFYVTLSRIGSHSSFRNGSTHALLRFDFYQSNELSLCSAAVELVGSDVSQGFAFRITSDGVLKDEVPQ